MSHGIYNTRYHWDFTIEEERAAMLESRAIHRALTGREQRGWFSPAITNTIKHLRSGGGNAATTTPPIFITTTSRFRSTSKQASCCRCRTQSTSTMSFCPGAARRPTRSRARSSFISTPFMTEGAEQGRVMCVALHPYWVGQPHRLRAIRSAFEYILSYPGVWQTTGAEIVDWYNANYLPLIESHLAARDAANG